MKKKFIKIFDTPLRDGEQSPGASMNIDEKVRVAKQLERLGVDVIEAGFPIASEGDFEAVRAVARDLKETCVCGLARTGSPDGARAPRSDRDYRVEVFRVALEAGASTLNVPDTVGYTQPEEYAALIRYLRE